MYTIRTSLYFPTHPFSPRCSCSFPSSSESEDEIAMFTLELSRETSSNWYRAMVKDALSLCSKSDSKSSIANRSFFGDSFVNHYTQLVKRSLRLVNLYVTTPFKGDQQRQNKFYYFERS